MKLDAFLARRLAALCAAAGFLLLSGCSILPAPQTDTAHYYVLTGPVEVDAFPNAQPAGALRIGLAQVDASAYLRKPIVVRTAANEIAYRDNDLWAESPAPAVTDLLAARLAAATNRVGQVLVEPFPIDAPRDYDVAVHLLRFEGERESGGKWVASFVCTIEVTRGTGSGRVLVARETFAAPADKWDGTDFGQLARLLSADVQLLGDEIVRLLPRQ